MLFFEVYGLEKGFSGVCITVWRIKYRCCRSCQKRGIKCNESLSFFLHYLGETGSFQSGHYFAFVFVFVFLLSWETGPFRIGQLKISRHYFVFVFFFFFVLFPISRGIVVKSDKKLLTSLVWFHRVNSVATISCQQKNTILGSRLNFLHKRQTQFKYSSICSFLLFWLEPLSLRRYYSRDISTSTENLKRWHFFQSKIHKNRLIKEYVISAIF